MRLSLIAILTTTFALSGCEIVASFDRDKIPPPKLMRPDGSFFPPPGSTDPLDAGLDGSTDSSITDVEGGMPEAGTDAQVDGADAAPASDGSAPDAAPADGSASDAGPADGSASDAA